MRRGMELNDSWFFGSIVLALSTIGTMAIADAHLRSDLVHSSLSSWCRVAALDARLAADTVGE